MAALVAAASAVGAGPSSIVLRCASAAGLSRDLSWFRNGVGAAPLVRAPFSSALQAPSMSFPFASYSPIPPPTSSSVSRSSSSCNSGWPISASSSQGFGGVSPTIRLTDNAGKTNVRSRGFGALQSMSLKCAALGNGGDGEPDVSNVAGGEVVVTGIENKDNLLVSGSPIVIVEAPVMLKTAEPMPMMRPNGGVIKPGDAGRVIDRRPKGLWAVRFAVGAYLIERKCFKPLDVQ